MSAVDEATVLRLRYETEALVEDLEAAERILRAEIDRRAERGERAGAEYAELAQVLRYRYAADGEPEHIRLAVAAQRRAVADGEGEPALLFRRALLAGTLVEAHEAGDPDSLREAVAQAQAVIRDAPGHLPSEYAAETYQTCAMVLAAWAQAYGDRKILTQAARAARTALHASAQDEQAAALDALAEIEWTMFQLTLKPGALEQAITLGRRALDAAIVIREDVGPNAMAAYHGNLGIRLARWSAYTADRADAADAVAMLREAIRLLPEQHPDLAMYLSNLGDALQTLHMLTDGAGLLDEAVEALRAAVDASTPDFRRAQRLGNLGVLLSDRHQRTGALADLDEGIDRLREAVDGAEFAVTDASILLKNLGLCLNGRYARLGTRDDLEEGIRALREAVALAASGARRERKASMTDALAALGGLLRDRFDLAGEPADLTEAKECFRRAIARTRSSDPDLARRLSDYAIVRREDGSRAGPRAAVRLMRRALRHVKPGDPVVRGLRSSLALALCMRNRRGDLDRALAAIEAAVAQTAQDDPEYVGLLTNLVYVLEERRVHPGYPDTDAQTFDAIRTAAREAALSRAAAPTWRLNAAQLWGEVSALQGDDADAARGYDLAVRLLAEYSPHRLAATDAQHRLGGVAGLPGTAAAAHLSAGWPESAVGLLELGRGVLLNRFVSARSSIDAVRETDATLADRFEELSEQIDALQAAGAEPVELNGVDAAGTADGARALAAASRERDRRRDLTVEFERVTELIRSDPRHAEFLQPPELTRLLAAAEEGPVVLVNLSADRADALLLTTAGLRPIPLPDATLEAADRAAADLYEASVHATDGTLEALLAGQETVTRILDWLWSAVARPVLRALGTTGGDGNASTLPPRIWWVPTQSLCLLPLHAATDRATGESVLDHCVPSYSPTITALLYARARRLAPTARRGLVLTSTASDPDRPPLPAALREAQAVAELLGTTPLDLATAGARLRAAFVDCTHLHVALHASADLADPSRSRFAVGGAGLAFSEISALHNRQARLAFLSACETSVTARSLADEALHLSTAVHLAGFREVIGTQWRVPELVAEYAAAVFYAELPEDGFDASAGVDGTDRAAASARSETSAAYALHRTVLALRDRFRDQPSAWAGYHHIGV
ncbi:CHAT domain-containing protein [Actinospica durhamensis]|uniref:CHAT domain-containing protein n=1 Tax=Actinospica durhamensis TaxID=1508375 RepID=A0A941IR92_9ACTN|nr:CHAT domain-containing protein [Actinospica durhamensis]MBR7837104.1 CHAT domain-containing protein [Actinospica durhamensis]